jgi:hypothetical protein
MNLKLTQLMYTNLFLRKDRLIFSENDPALVYELVSITATQTCFCNCMNMYHSYTCMFLHLYVQ